MASVPRWKTALEKAIKTQEKSPVFQLSTIATISKDGNKQPSPHVRSHAFRTFLNAKHHENLPVIITTTDIRTPKATQLNANPNVELAWWVEGTQEQFRITGKAIAFRDTLPSSGSPGKMVENSKSLRALTEESYEWHSKSLEVFNSLSGHMRASWCRPIPGTPLIGGPDEAKKWPETLPKLGEAIPGSEEMKNVEEAFKNFALLVIDPSEVDYVELGVVPNRRTKFSLSGEVGDEGGKWVEEALVP